MYVDTTIHINIKLLEKVEAASKLLKMSRSKIIILLLNRVMDQKEIPIEMFKQIKYQPRDLPSNWKRIHVYPEVQEYESWLDIRKIFKRSVSLVAAMAIQGYLDLLIEELTSTEKSVHSDNYPANYLFLARESAGLQKFVIYWGFPEETHLAEYFT